MLPLFLATIFSSVLYSLADSITKDGDAAMIAGYSGTVYYAVDYIPVCGTLGPGPLLPG